MVLRLFILISFFASLVACERIPISERRSVLIEQEQTTQRLQEFRSLLWVCKANATQTTDQNSETLGQRIEQFVDGFRSKGLSSVETFDVSLIRATAFLWRDSGILVSQYSAFEDADIENIGTVECTDGLNPWIPVKIKGTDRSLDIVAFGIDAKHVKNRSQWVSRDDRPRIHEDLLLVSMSFPGQIDVTSVRVQPQLSQMKTGIDSDLLLFSPLPSPIFRGAVLVDQSFKVLGLASDHHQKLWGVALSASRIETSIDNILKYGSVEHAFIGFKLSPSDKGIAIQQVEVGGPAYRAGLRIDDVIISWNSQELKSLNDWTEPDGSMIGKAVPVVYERDGKRIEAKIKIGSLK